MCICRRGCLFSLTNNETGSFGICSSHWNILPLQEGWLIRKGLYLCYVQMSVIYLCMHVYVCLVTFPCCAVLLDVELRNIYLITGYTPIFKTWVNLFKKWKLTHLPQSVGVFLENRGTLWLYLVPLQTKARCDFCSWIFWPVEKGLSEVANSLV